MSFKDILISIGLLILVVGGIAVVVEEGAEKSRMRKRSEMVPALAVRIADLERRVAAVEGSTNIAAQWPNGGR